MDPARRRLAIHAGVVLFVFAAAYWTAVGGGFISDDFRWILESRIREWPDVQRVFVDTTGFYRPVIALGIAALESFAGNNPRPYGIALFFLAIACAGAVSFLARSLGLRAGAALLAGSVWLLNPHGINMAILWVSGLTALCLVFFSTASAIAVQHGRPLAATVLFFAALLSKEEATLLPIPLLLIAVMRPLRQAKQWTLVAGLVGAEALYFYLRSHSDAATPATAPSFYRFTFQPADVVSNLLQYADRSLTISVLVLLIVLGVVRAKAHLDHAERSAIAIGTTWLVAGFGITLFLPVRSSLYALLPSVGSVIALSAVVGALWRQATPGRRKTLQIIAIALPLCLLPILKARTARWTELMRVTDLTLQAIVPSIASRPSALLLVDDPDRRDNLENAFGSLLPDAIELYAGQRPEVWVVPVPSDSTPSQTERLPASIALAWRYQNGRMERMEARDWVGIEALRMR